MNKIIRNTIILTVITVISGFLLGLVYEITAEPIARTQEAAKKEAWQAVFPEASEDAFQQIDVDADVAAQVVKTWAWTLRWTKSARLTAARQVM